MNYYNEIDPYADQWLRNLIANRLIPAGDVDTRDIRDVTPSDLTPYTQCHFFAGIGGWPYALRLASFSADRKVWTGSCPCQPFSQAGALGGFDDERHLWPAWHHLIRVCRPPVILGEQVASRQGLEWLDLVWSDLETEGYAVGAADLCAAGAGAPHIRQRLWFVAHDQGAKRFEHRTVANGMQSEFTNGGELVQPICGGRPSWQSSATTVGHGSAAVAAGGVGDALGEGLARPSRQSGDNGAQRETAERAGSHVGELGVSDREREASAGGFPGGTSVECGRSFWAEAEWIDCRDGKRRPVEPGTFPLAHGVSARVAKLRALGNAIVPQVAAEFIRAALEL
jgi:DNA (cytosine-5)-methyltransferase 1